MEEVEAVTFELPLASSHHGLWAITSCSTNMVRVIIKKSSLQNKVGKIIFGVFLDLILTAV